MKIRTMLVAGALMAALPARADLKAGDRPADFEGKTASGQTVKLSALKGKVVLVDFWASWCEPCKKELPLLGKMATRLKPRGIEIVTVNIDDKRENAEAFLKERQLTGLTVVSDKDKRIVAAWEPPKMPSSFVLDKSGVVRAVNAGFDDGDESKIERQLTQLAGK